MTLTLSIIATALSALSLLWQFISWRSSGARLSVNFTRVIPVGGDWDQHVGIQIRNKGRAQTVISSACIILPDNRNAPFIADAFRQFHLPYTIQPGEEIALTFPVGLVEDLRRQPGINAKSKIRPSVTTGHGNTTGKPWKVGDI